MEKELLGSANKINIINGIEKNIGHHGSSTSSTSTFIDGVDPKVSLISVGQNNYGHPTDEVLNNLSSSLIYRTDLRGSINIKIKNNKLNIETYKP